MSKSLKRILISLLICVAGLLGLRIYINSILKDVIYEQVKSFSKNNYKLHVDKIDIGILAFNATIQGFNLKHVTDNADSIVPYSNIKATSIRLRGLSLIKLIFSRSLNLRSFELIDPKIDLYYNSNYSDSLKTKAAVDLFTIQIKKLQLKNVVINLYNFGESITTIKAQNLYYDIKTLNLEIDNIRIDQAKKDSSKLHVALNTGTVDGFYLNELFNKRTFRYSEIRFDKINVSVYKHKNTEEELNEKTEKVKNLTQSKFFIAIKPVNINRLRFTMSNGNKKVSFNGNELLYKNRDFSIKSFNLDLVQNFKTKIVSKDLEIKGMDADSINDGYQIAVNSLELVEPKINLVLQNKMDNNDTGTSILKLFSIKRVNSLTLKKAFVEISHNEKKRMKAYFKNIDFSAKNVVPVNGFLFFNNASFSATDLFFNMPNNLYNFKIARISYSQKTGNAAISNFKLTPNYDKKSFAKIISKQVARITITVETIDLQNFNILHIVNRQTFACNKVVVNQMNAAFYKDKNIPLLASDYKKFPQEMIREFGFGLNVNTIEIRNSLLSSEVLSPNAGNSGKIEVDNVNMILKGVDNTKNSSNSLELTFKGRLARTGLIVASAHLPINDLLCNHTAHIEIDKMPFKKLNTFINDVIHVSIAKGELDKAIIDIKGNKKEINCKLKLQYHDLNMKILADESTSKNENKLNIATKLANAVIINNNPEPGKAVRISNTKIPTELNKFIINNWIFSTLNSMLYTTAPGVINFMKKAKPVK